jgi:hypothetical protein
MKKSKYVELVLITAALASCGQPSKEKDWEGGGGSSRTYLRSDTTAPYTQARHHGGVGTALLWYYAFRPFGNFSNGGYQRAGYYSNALNRSSNIGSNGFKGAVSRGGFGRGSYSVSS